MANRTLFVNRGIQKQVPPTNTFNEAGGKAYKLSPKLALAQYVVTGTFNNTYYVNASDQLRQVEELARECDSTFLAKLAVYGREIAKMKDTPAYLLALLTARGELSLLTRIFDRVCNNSKMLLNYVQIIRSGAVGRRSFGSCPKRLIKHWIKSKNPMGLYLASLGHSNPSMADVIRMVRPKPTNAEEQTIYHYLTGLQSATGLKADKSLLPMALQKLEELKNGTSQSIPDVPFRALTNLDLTTKQWQAIGLNMPWNTLRMNLNMLERKGVFADYAYTKTIADKLHNPNEVKKNNVFPYQLLTTWQNTTSLPAAIRNAIHDAMEIATENVPIFDGQTVVAVDVSGSMSSHITGQSRTSSVTRCVDVAGLIASCILRKNKEAVVYAFDYTGRNYRNNQYTISPGLYDLQLNPYDSVMTNTQKFAQIQGGGTNCSLPLRHINANKMKLDNFIMISDNVSWSGPCANGDGYMTEWKTLKGRCSNAKLINVDIQPYGTTQSPDTNNEILNIGGFSDVVFTIMDDFLKRNSNDTFVDLIENGVEL